ncbi:MAG: hypothetical protein JWM99_3342 [Verrucomicrobiales bacterium]|nr:hypothetical protein [Verrucomicrobiales bacterium]
MKNHFCFFGFVEETGKKAAEKSLFGPCHMVHFWHLNRSKTREGVRVLANAL